MHKDDLVRVRHMVDAAKEALSFVQGKTRDHLEQDRQLALSLIRLIEVVGEAAAQVTEGFQTSHPEIPWAVIVGMRNRLIHAYFDIDLDRVWDTAKDDLPLLVTQLDQIAKKG